MANKDKKPEEVCRSSKSSQCSPVNVRHEKSM
ncbi:uncharacterized protein FTOL_13951 [Fusarium torulosum]|uniref:Uncharacterized protein n=1 Tax=Fusarium torulosum TaxID=33205 RepID=A0AAE8SQQ0_9HYPO|nr:uncharacterized protein FTOL_13951 [Fusarium torulosum]